jgi:hypothetical protein
MKKLAVILSLAFVFILSGGFSKSITSKDAKNVAAKFVTQFQKNGYDIQDFFELKNETSVLAFVFNLIPHGYVVVSASTDLSPIPAYSFESNFGVISSENTLYRMLKTDLTEQQKNAGGVWTVANAEKWSQFLQSNMDKPKDDFQQWPETGNGWLKTNWTQSAPYSNFCPIDPVTSQRSYTGCPATAMSQILNFHASANGTHFDNSDDYYHNYAGRQYHIDDDFAANGFPSFPDLNKYLDTLQVHWNTNAVITNNDKAALNFACGVAAKQVFTSAGSGTFSVSQAQDAYTRFGCTTAVLIYPSDTSLISHLAQNMKDTLPAHLAIVDSAETTGHNVVVDGYNTNGYFHVNFGWGGSSNGWYLLPQEMPMSLTCFEGVVMDIMKEIPDGINTDIKTNTNLSVYPNPFVNELNFSYNLTAPGDVTIHIWDISGKLLCSKTQTFTKSGTQALNISDFNNNSGVFFYQLITPDSSTSGKVIRLGNN